MFFREPKQPWMGSNIDQRAKSTISRVEWPQHIFKYEHNLDKEGLDFTNESHHEVIIKFTQQVLDNTFNILL
jgi:hypothetical protein